MFKELFINEGTLTGRSEGLDWKYSRGYLTIYGERTGKPVFKEKLPNASLGDIDKMIKKYVEKRNY